MVKKNARQLKTGDNAGVYRFPDNPYDSDRESELAWTRKHIKEGKLARKKLTLMDNNGSIDVTMFYKAFAIVANPIHPDNNWRSVVEKMAVGKDVYYRLATEIPIPVMEYWKSHGHPPACGWEIFDPNTSSARKASVPEYLEEALPAKPERKAPAKKAKPVEEKIPAKSIPTVSSYKGTPMDNLPRHPKNPFRPGSGYGLLVDIIAWAEVGIYKGALISMYRHFTGKPEARAGFDLTVIASAQRGKPRHESCREGFFILKQGDIYSIEFE